jgi:hypothetical protein
MCSICGKAVDRADSHVMSQPAAAEARYFHAGCLNRQEDPSDWEGLGLT